MLQLVGCVLQYLGFLLHPDKLKLRPSQARLFLGTVVDSSNHMNVVLRLPASKLNGTRRRAQQCRSLLRRGQLTLRVLAGVLGKCSNNSNEVCIGPHSIL